MKVLIAAGEEYDLFIRRAILPYNHDHKFVVTTRKPTTDFLDYDLGISFMWTSKIQKHELNVPWINFHPAPLPEYKGRNLCYHAIMNGETEFGATVHYMDENFDTGDIIWVDRFKILPSDTAEDISEQAISISKVQFKRFLPRILNGEAFSTSKNVGGTYYKKEEIDDFLYLTEWNKNRIRAITYKEFYPKIVIGGVTYKVARE